MTTLSKPKELIFAMSMTAVSIAFLFGTYIYPEESVTFPRFLVVLSIFFSALLLVQAIRTPASRQASSQRPLTRIALPIKVFVSVSIYVAAIDIVGFYISSALFLLGSMLMYGNDRWATRLAVMAGFLLVVYVLFGWLIGVRLPSGLLF